MQILKLEQSRPATNGRVCDAFRWKALPKCGVGTLQSITKQTKEPEVTAEYFLFIGRCWEEASI